MPPGIRIEGCIPCFGRLQNLDLMSMDNNAKGKNTHAQMKKVTALVCNSNMFVPYVLSEILAHKDEYFLIMTDIDNMAIFFREIKIENSSLIHYRHPTIYDIYNTRRELISKTETFDIQKIIFFHAEFGGIINWFILKKAKKARIYYCKVFNSLPYSRLYNFSALKLWISERLLSGVSMEILNSKLRPIPSLPKSYFRKIGALPYKIELDYKKINILLSESIEKVNLKARVVMCTGATVADNCVEESEYISKTDTLIEAIGKENCVAKCHPRYTDVFGKELELSTIPSYFPGNLIIGNYDVFISNNSTLLVEAAIAGKIAISLINYYKQTNEGLVEEIKSFYKDRLNGRGVIYYPTTVEEVLKIIENNSILC